MRRCPGCKGEQVIGYDLRTCCICLGDGEIEPDYYDRLLNGHRLIKSRQARNLSVAEEAARLGISDDDLLAQEFGMPLEEYAARQRLAARIPPRKEPLLCS